MVKDKVKCVIVEDEQHNMRLIQKYVGQINRLELVGSYVSPLEMINAEVLEETQIIYLDIQTPGMTGIDFLKSFPVQAEIILITAYGQYALDGYELNITDYLLKPVEFPRFLSATNKAISRIETAKRLSMLDDDKFIMLKVDKRLVRVSIGDIVYIKSDWNYMHVHLRNMKYVVLGTLSDMEQDLQQHNFVRIHKSYLINICHLDYVEGNQVQIAGEKLQISRGYKTEFLRRII